MNHSQVAHSFFHSERIQGKGCNVFYEKDKISHTAVFRKKVYPEIFANINSEQLQQKVIEALHEHATKTA